MLLSLPRLFLALGLGLLLVQSAQAGERFDISLSGDHLGQLTHERSGNTQDLTLLLNSTPFGVFDGTYSGRTVSSGTVARHSGRTRSTRKSRDLSMRLEGGQPREVALLPETERTMLSEAAAVPGAVLDPVRGFDALLDVAACPNGVRIYDGRRVGLLSLVEARRTANEVTCRASYQVTEGPGYLEPLGISRLSVELTYDAKDPDWQLILMNARSGPFALILSRETPR